MKKKVLVSFVILFCIMIMPIGVEAADYIEDSCVDNDSCMVVCSYSTNHKSASGENYGPRYITVYYNFKNEINNWKVSWQGYTGSMDSNGNVRYTPYSKGFNPFSYVFSDASSSDRNYSIYIPKRYNSDNFTCPTNAYLDFSSLRSYNEVCFDNNGTWCTEDKSNVGTDFEKASTKVYDFSDEIETYFNLWYNGEVKNSLTCDNIYNGTAGDNIYDTLMTEFTTDMTNMFVFNGASGDNIPEFVINSPGWNNASSTLENYVYDVTNSCRNAAEEDYRNGDITEEERDRRLGLLDDYDEDTENAADRHTDPRTNNATTDNWNKDIQCEDIFTDDPGSVGWMLNTIFNYIKIIGPILVVLLSSIDFIKAVVGTDEKAMKEAQSKLVIRLVAAVALFLIPTLVQLLLSFVNQVYCSFM